MSDAIDQAASAFQNEITPSSRSSAQSSNDDSSSETLFPNLGQLDEDTSPVGGGDDLPPPVKARKQKQEENLEDEDEVLEESEDEGEEEEGEGEENEDEYDKEEDEDDSDVYQVVVDGEPIEVSLREALDGYIRTETFHRRMNWLNNARETIRAEAIKVVEDRQTYSGLVAKMQKQLDMLVPAEPNWDEEYSRDPKAASELRKNYEAYKRQRAELDAEAERVRREQEEEDARNTAEYIQQENAKILRNHPNWKDPKVMERDLAAMVETAERAGFSREEAISTKDSRMVSLLYKAMKYDKIQANKPKPVRRGKASTTPSKPGAGSTRTAPKAQGKAQSRLRQTGSVEDAANVFKQILRSK